MPHVLTNIHELAACRAGLPLDDAGRVRRSEFALNDDLPTDDHPQTMTCSVESFGRLMASNHVLCQPHDR
jgi:hypothetical protein